MGVVYRATHVALDHLVALKVISPALASDARFRRRFEEESRIAVSIRHPNVVPIHNAGEEDGLLFVTMDLIEGTDLRGVLNREGTVDPQRTARIVSEVASALDAAHARGLVHRDIKPGNILVEGSGETERTYLTDFGLARQVDATTGVTATGAFVGTLDYVAPEQIRGERVDARADVYALGCVLYELLTGNPPFAARDDKVAKMYAHLEEDPPSLRVMRPDLPGGLDLVIKRALAKDPADRFPSAGDLARAVAAAVEGGQTMEAERSVGVGPAAPGPPEATTTTERRVDKSTVAAPAVPEAPKPRDSRLMVVAGIVGALAAVAAVVLIVSGGGGDDGDGTTATPTDTTINEVASNAKVDGDPVKVGELPVNLAHGQEGLWVTNRLSGSVSLVDGDPAKEVDQFETSSRPEGVAVGDGSIWVTLTPTDTLVRMDPDSGAVTNRITVGDRPGEVAFAFDFIWVANYGANTLSKIDPSTNTVVKTIAVGQGPYGLASDDEYVWVTNRIDDTVSRVTPENGHVDQPIRVGDNPKGIAADATGVWVANTNDNTVSHISAAQAGKPIEVGASPRGVASGFGSIWVSSGLSETVSQIDPKRDEVIKEIQVGPAPEGITAGPVSIWVANGANGTLTRIDPGESPAG
jgi:serine/threonine-protein kinase